MSDIEKLKVVELRAELTKLGLDSKGNKAVLVKRLIAATNKEKGIANTASASEEGADEGDGDTSQDEALDSSTLDTSEADVSTSTVKSPVVSADKNIKKETPKKDAPKAETPKKDAPKAETPKKEAPKTEAIKKESPKADTPKKEPPKVEAIKKETPKAETAKPAPKVETPKKEPAKAASPKVVAVKKEPAKAEVPKKDSPKVESPKKELVTKAETPKKETTKTVAPKKEPTTEETLKTEEHKDDEPAVAIKPTVIVLDIADDDDGGEHNKEDNVENGIDTSQDVILMEVDTDSKADESDSTKQQGEKRPRSGSRSPGRKKVRSHSRDKRRSKSRSPFKVVEDEDDTFDDALLTLDTYHSDLNLTIDKTRYSAASMSNDGFGFMWAGARATYGFTEGKVAFEVKVVKHLEAKHLPADEINPHVVRVGFSVSSSSLQLGEDPLSYGYGGTGKASCNCEFKDYGTEFKEEDVITAFLNSNVDPVEISFAKNGEHLGTAYSIPKEELGDKALFPHILTKNCSFDVNFGQKEEPFFKFPEGFEDYVFVHATEADKRVRAPKPPAKRDECEMIMMCGLPGSGKTTWATNYCNLHPEKNYNIIGTNAIIDKMKVMGLPRKRNYAGRWDALIEKSTTCLNRILDMGSRRRRNYILDQTNVYASAQRRKMRPFEGFKRRAVVLVPTDEEFKSRIANREKEEGKDVPDKAVLEMKANFVLPEVGNIFSEVDYVELPAAEAATLIEQYVKEGRAAIPPRRNFNKNDRRRQPSRFGPPRDRGNFRGRDDRRFGGMPMRGFGGGHPGRGGGPMHGGRAPAQRGPPHRGSFGQMAQSRGPPLMGRMGGGGGGNAGGRRGNGGGGGGSGGRRGNAGAGGPGPNRRDRRGGSMGGGKRDQKFGGGMGGGSKGQHYGGGGGGGYNQGFQGGYYNQQQQGFNQQGGNYPNPWKNQQGGNAPYQNYGQGQNYQSHQQLPPAGNNPQTSYGHGQQYYNQQWDQWNQQNQQYYNQYYNQQQQQQQYYNNNPSQQFTNFSQK